MTYCSTQTQTYGTTWNSPVGTRGAGNMIFSYFIGKLLLKATTTIYNVRVVIVCIVFTLLFLTHSFQKHSGIAVMTVYLQVREQDHCNRVLRHMCNEEMW